MAARHQRRVTGRADARRRGRRRLRVATAATGSRCSGCPPRSGAARSRRNFDVDGYEHIDAGLAAGKRRDPRAAAPRRLGVAGRVDRATRATTCSPSSSRSSRPSSSSGSSQQREAIGMESCRSGPTCRRRCCARCATTASCACSATVTSPATASRSSSSASARRCRPARRRSRCGPARRLLPVAVYFRPGRGHHAVVRPPIPTRARGRLRDDIARITQELAREFEALIRPKPRAVAPAAAELAERPPDCERAGRRT